MCNERDCTYLVVARKDSSFECCVFCFFFPLVVSFFEKDVLLCSQYADVIAYIDLCCVETKQLDIDREE